MYQQVVLIGNLGQDPETRFTGSGTAVCNFSVATSKGVKQKDGSWKDVTTWHKIVAWAKLAEACQKSLAKGSKVCVVGEIQKREWEDREGNKRESFEIVAHLVKFLSPKREQAEASAAQEEAAPAASAKVDDSDIPF